MYVRKYRVMGEFGMLFFVCFLAWYIHGVSESIHLERQALEGKYVDIRVNPMTLRQLLGLCDACREIGNDEFVCAIDLTSLPD